MKDYIRIARIDHWINNLFILPGVGAAILILKTKLDVNIWMQIFAALLATSLAASANYVINEWLDAEFDKFHPIKKTRPAVAVGLRRKWVIVEYLVLLISSILLAFIINHLFALAIVWLLIMGIIYNVEPLRTKDIPFLDVLSESVNNMIRLLLGWFVLASNHLPPVSLLFGYWMGGAFLMAAKRFAEYRMIGNPEIAGRYRRSFKHYNEVSLLVSSVCYAMISLFFVGIFLVKYKIELLFAVPLLIAMFCKYLEIAFREDSAAQKPEKLYRERGLMLWCTAFVIILSIALVVKVPWLNIFIGSDLVPLNL